MTSILARGLKLDGIFDFNEIVYALDSNDVDPREGIETEQVLGPTHPDTARIQMTSILARGLKQLGCGARREQRVDIQMTSILARGLKLKPRANASSLNYDSNDVDPREGIETLYAEPLRGSCGPYIQMTSILARGLKLNWEPAAAQATLLPIQMTSILARGLKL